MKIHLKSNIFKGIFIAFSMILFSGCGNDTKTVTSDVNSIHPMSVKNVLFAHGFLSSADTWNHYVEVTSDYADREWVIYRTDVSDTGSIVRRAGQLADYINAQGLEDNSMIVIGHSMGGLDLRYIISQGNQNQTDDNKYYKAAKKIYKFYTIATPHKGVEIANILPEDNGAVSDLSADHMSMFNKEHPYSNSSIDGRKIEMLAFRFACDDDKSTDGIVPIESQVLDGAPYTKEVLDGKHTTARHIIICEDDVIAELNQNSIINNILDNSTPEQITSL
ncbi:MAG: Unknown protein [uncultured Sulfurovum sp.]|uniref:DUF676 domain-containing protein n=1 Tax=uncultured Sulfurovum sp. TaxID=269237 RepID=A0A6S6U549_9BACT|nr:MAG: Unknown protein [uncultured Sulfurovum sp.]